MQYRYSKKTLEILNQIINLSGDLYSQISHLETKNRVLSDKVRANVRKRLNVVLDIISEMNRQYNRLMKEPILKTAVDSDVLCVAKRMATHYERPQSPY